MSEEVIEVVESAKSSESLNFINQMFKWWWISLILALPTCGLGAIAFGVFGFILLFQYWKLVPQGVSNVTPGKAVGLSFIPIFNIYWVFRSFGELGEILYNLTDRERPSIKVIALIVCWLGVVNFIYPITIMCIYGFYSPLWATLINNFFTIISLVFYIIVYCKFQNAARQILKK